MPGMLGRRETGTGTGDHTRARAGREACQLHSSLRKMQRRSTK
eukprot:COSAG06_NODE_2258_length_7221_cov_12.506599_8_plen_43_part_00